MVTAAVIMMTVMMAVGDADEGAGDGDGCGRR